MPSGVYPRPSLAFRFWAKVRKTDDCWLWTGKRNPHGYGVLWHPTPAAPRRMRGAHRVAWELAYGSIADGLNVCHRCDRPACVRPEHLFLGSQLANMRDAKLKQRVPHGDEHYSRRSPETFRRTRTGDNHWTHRMPARAPRGEANPRARLTEEQVSAIRKHYSSGDVTQRQLACEYGVAQSTISRLLAGQCWQHLA